MNALSLLTTSGPGRLHRFRTDSVGQVITLDSAECATVEPHTLHSTLKLPIPADMNLPNLLHKTSATLLGVATLVLGADLVHAMTKEALVGKAPVRHCPSRHS